MSTAIGGVDNVSEGGDVFGERIVVLKSGFNANGDVVDSGGAGERNGRVKGFFVFVEVFN